MSNDGTIVGELERIRLANGGLLRPEDVVEAARPKVSPLHNQFEWDDTEAATQYRLWQARQLIRVAVTVLPKAQQPIRAYVSLRTDRRSPGGGYRTLCDVLGDDVLREQLLIEALADLDTFRMKYGRLKELAPVFSAAGRIAARHRGRSRAAG